MELLERRILSEGEVLPGNVVKVGSFLNHQIDVSLLLEMGREVNRLFSDAGAVAAKVDGGENVYRKRAEHLFGRSHVCVGAGAFFRQDDKRLHRPVHSVRSAFRNAQIA